MHDSSVAEADPIRQHDWLAGVDVQAAQILDIALSADHDLVVIGAQHRSVPDRRGPSERDPADYDRARRDPGFGVNRRMVVTKRSNQRVHTTDCRRRRPRAGLCPSATIGAAKRKNIYKPPFRLRHVTLPDRVNSSVVASSRACGRSGPPEEPR